MQWSTPARIIMEVHFPASLKSFTFPDDFPKKAIQFSGRETETIPINISVLIINEIDAN